MKIHTGFVLLVLIFIIFVAFQTMALSRRALCATDSEMGSGIDGLSEEIINGQFTEGYQENDIEYDVAKMNSIHAEKGFQVVNSSMDDFIIYLKQRGYTASLISQPGATNFTPSDQGVCMTDWWQRAIRQSLYGQPNGTGVSNSWSHQMTYDACKARAISMNANEFGLQYGYECWVGNTQDMTLGNQLDPNSGRVAQQRPEHECNRPGFGIGNGGGWRQMVYRKLPPVQKYMFDDYGAKVQQWMDKGYTDSDKLKRTGFTTMQEGFTLTRTQQEQAELDAIEKSERPVTKDDIITFVNNLGQTVMIDADKINACLNLNYTFTVGEKNELFKKMDTYNGVYYIKAMKLFKIDSESASLLFFDKIRQLNPHPNSLVYPHIFVLALYLFYGLDANAFINTTGNTTETPWFVKTIEKYELHKLNNLPVFTSTSFNDDWNNNVLSKFNAIGVTPRNIDAFCSVFISRGASMQIFFDKIYPVLKSDVFRYWYRGDKDLITMIDTYISRIDPANLANAFEQFNEILKSLVLTTYSSYVTFITRALQIGAISEIKLLLGKFKAYYPTIAYSDDPASLKLANEKISNKSLIITANSIFDEFIDKIPGYFSFCATDFGGYLTLITERNYTIAAMKRDFEIGGTYCKYASVNKSKAGFSTLTADPIEVFNLESAISYYLNYANQTVKQLLGYSTEGLTSSKTTPPQNTILSSFGINDHATQLGKLESMLIFGKNYGFQTLDDVILFIDPLRTLIQFSSLEEYIKIMVDFGAINKTSWISVTTGLSKLNITDFTNIREFLKIIMTIGVNFENFEEFSNKIGKNHFKSDFILSRPSLADSAIRVFCADMNLIGFRYDNETKQKIHNLMNYFVVLGFNLQSYSSSPGLPHSLVVSMNSYNSSSQYRHNFFDLTQDPPLSKLFPSETANTMMSQGYYIASEQMNDSILNNEAAKTILASFLYTTEYDELQKDNGKVYSDVKIRITLMNDIAAAMNLMAIGYNPENQDNKEAFKLYTNLTNLTRMFPMLMFQHLHRLIMSKCRNGKCTFSVNNPTDVNYVHSSSKYRTINTIPPK